MGLAADIDYQHSRPNVVQRALHALVATRPGAWVFSRTLPAIDRAIDRLTNGRTSLPRLLTGLPVLVLTSTGRKSGQLRETYLIAVPLGDDLALLGTNFGQPRTPAWALNLEADPRAAVTHHGITRDVEARPATEDEREQVLTSSTDIYIGYVKYQQRITGRALRIFVLEPAPAG